MAASAAQSMALPVIVDLDSLDAIRDKLLDAVDHGHAEVDAAAVERVATNALLMLLSAAETAQRNQFKLTVVNVSEPMESAISRLGLASAFQPLTQGLAQ